MEIILFWLIFSVVVAVIANNRGRSGIGWFLFSVVLSPILGLILVLAFGRPGTDAPAQPVIGVADELTKLGALRESGVITDDEYDRQRAKLLTPAGPQQAPKGTICGKCGKLLSPVWRDKCNHCGARYTQYPPVARSG